MYLYVPGLASRSALDTSASRLESGWFAPEFDLWVLLSGKPTRLRSSLIEWKKVPWIAVLSGTLWSPSTAARIAAEWISSLPASLVRARASPENDAASTTSAGYGPRSGASRAKSKQAGSSPRTSPDSFPLTVVEHSRKSSGTWARAGGLHAGTVFPLEPSAPRTSEIASSCSLPTPTASEYGSSQNGINGRGGAHERPSAGTPSLMTMARKGMLPTPLAMSARQRGRRNNTKSGHTLSEAVETMPKKMPTPRASDATKGARSQPDRSGKQGPTLPEYINRLRDRGGASDADDPGLPSERRRRQLDQGERTERRSDVDRRGRPWPRHLDEVVDGVLAEGRSHWDWSCAPEPTIRGVDAGPASGMDIDSYAEELHLLGNGVVPHAAAFAFAILWDRLHGGAALADDAAAEG